MQLGTICDSVLYAHLSKVANTAEKRHYLHALCTAVDTQDLDFCELDKFLDILHKFKVFDLHLSVPELYDFRVLLFIMGQTFGLSDYFRRFRSDPERGREFHYEEGLWHTFVATRNMRFLRTLSDSR